METVCDRAVCVSGVCPLCSPPSKKCADGSSSEDLFTHGASSSRVSLSPELLWNNVRWSSRSVNSSSLWTQLYFDWFQMCAGLWKQVGQVDNTCSCHIKIISTVWCILIISTHQYWFIDYSILLIDYSPMIDSVRSCHTSSCFICDMMMWRHRCCRCVRARARCPSCRRSSVSEKLLMSCDSLMLWSTEYSGLRSDELFLWCLTLCELCLPKKSSPEFMFVRCS